MVRIDRTQLPTDAAGLRTLLLELVDERDRFIEEHDRLRRERDDLAREREHLLHQLRLRLKALYGPRAERLDDSQLELFAAEIESERAKSQAESKVVEVAPHTRRRRGRKAIPASLPREDVLHDLTDEEKRCPCCGELRVEIAREFNEVLEIVPAQVKVIRHVRPKYACPTCRGQVAIAAPAVMPVPKGKAGPGLLAMVAVNKFADHQPLYRQEGILKRHGQGDWMRQVGDLVQPLVGRMAHLVRQSKVIQSDDTPVRVLDPGRGKTREGRFWSYLGDQGHRYAVFEYTRSREGRWPQRWLAGYEGYVQADAFSGYDALYATGKVIEVGCWAHARRKFYDARTLDPGRCLHVLGEIRRLYAVEDRGAELEAQARAQLRKAEAAPVLEELKGYLGRERALVLPKSAVGEAIEYALNQWTALNRYLEDGDLEIDNNAVERTLRGVAIGRRNWLFCGSDFGGETAAAHFSVIGSARLHELEPWAYVRDVLVRLPSIPLSRLDELLPDRWKIEHPDAILPLGR